MMRVIGFHTIQALDISCLQSVAWVEEALRLKSESMLPAKISMKLQNNIFFNTMPCYIPSLKRIGVKMVSRYPGRIPSLAGEIFLFDAVTGAFLATMNGDWITTMRTGAVAALTITTLQAVEGGVYSFVGLGNTARATLLCLLALQPGQHHHVRLLSYKDQAERFMERFSRYDNITFETVHDHADLVRDADVVVSCVTAFDTLFAPDDAYREGVLVVPVHTRGFQNCDLFFDRVIGDDYNHIRDFRYFNQFSSFSEFSAVFTGAEEGRIDARERIIAYNIGIALLDLYFASRIYDRVNEDDSVQVELKHPDEKFWI